MTDKKQDDNGFNLTEVYADLKAKGIDIPPEQFMKSIQKLMALGLIEPIPEDELSRKRKVLFDEMGKLIKEDKIKSTDKLVDDSFVIASRVKDYDFADNEVWKIEKNKSLDRGEKCGKCKSPLVTSGGMQDMIDKARKEKIKFKLRCNQCMEKYIKKMKKEEKK